MDQVTIAAQVRTALGKKNGALRRSGITPIHVYGREADSLTLQADTVDLVHTLAQVGFTTPLTLQTGDDEHFVIVQTIQRHPVNEQLLHVDFLQVSRTERRLVSVPLHFEGEAAGARGDGAMVAEDFHAIDLEALITEVPSSLAVDVSVMTDEDSVIYAKDLVLPSGATLVTDPELPIARIVFRRGAEGVEAVGGGEDGAPGTAAPAPAAADGGGGGVPEGSE
jgi:large subunit ribosomal protein L25